MPFAMPFGAHKKPLRDLSAEVEQISIARDQELRSAGDGELQEGLILTSSKPLGRGGCQFSAI